MAIDRGDPSIPEVALVVNFGAGYAPAPEMLDLLQTARVPATFMIMGWIARERPDLVRAIAIHGFEIGSHGDQVPDLTLVSDAEVAADLQAADQTLATLIGHSTRPLWSPSAGAQDARVRRVAASAGYRTLLWTVDSGDWRTDASAASVERLVLPHLASGAIVVLHFDSPHSRDATVPALSVIIAALRERGLRPVTMSALLAHLDGRTAAP